MITQVGPRAPQNPSTCQQPPRQVPGPPPQAPGPQWAQDPLPSQDAAPQPRLMPSAKPDADAPPQRYQVPPSSPVTRAPGTAGSHRPFWSLPVPALPESPNSQEAPLLPGRAWLGPPRPASCPALRAAEPPPWVPRHRSKGSREWGDPPHRGDRDGRQRGAMAPASPSSPRKGPRPRCQAGNGQPDWGGGSGVTAPPPETPQLWGRAAPPGCC